MKGRSINQFTRQRRRSRHIAARMAILMLVLLGMAPLSRLARPALAASVGTFSIDDVIVVEGDSGTVDAIFTVTLNRIALGTATVAYVTPSTPNAAVVGNPCPTTPGGGVDLLSTSGNLTFDGETTTRNVVVRVCGDTSRELDETFAINLFGPVNAGLADTQGIGAIRNDDDNNAPVAKGQLRSITGVYPNNTNEDSALTLTLVATDIDLDCPSFAIVTQPQHGSLSGFSLQPCQLAGNTATGRLNIIYTPAPNYNDADSFTFKANDGTIDSNVATVEIDIIPVNDPPVMLNDSYSVVENTTLTVPAPGVLANDSDPVEGSPLTAILRSGSGPGNGTLTLNANGGFTYKPNTNFVGTDSFQYRASDGFSGSTFATVTIAVTAAQKAPVASGQLVATDEDTAASITLSATDANGDSLAYTIVAPPVHGDLSGSAPDLIYTPHANYNGPDSFTFKANDGALGSNIATVAIAIGPVNDAPVAMDDSYSADEDSTMTIAAAGVLGNDTDIDTTALAAVLVAGVANGVLALNEDGSFAYTPEANFCGADGFRYQAHDGALPSNQATVTINVACANDAPISAADSYAIDEDTPLTIAAAGVLGNDADVDGATLTAIFVGGPSHGTLALNPDGSFTYTPEADFYGDDSFSYQASDGTLDSNVATVTIAISAANDAPVANDQATTADTGTPKLITLSASDVDSSALTYSIVAGPAYGTLSGTAPNVTYTPNAGYSGPDSFTFRASDGALDSNIATVSIAIDSPAVVYNFSGFFQPVDNLPTFNSVSAGRAIPVKFGLGGYFGLNIFAAGYPASQQIKCDTAAPVDAVEETTTAGESSLSYDPASGRYSYVWKTEKAWAGTCRQLIVRFNDGGPDRIAYFKLNK